MAFTVPTLEIIEHEKLSRNIQQLIADNNNMNQLQFLFR